MRPSNIPNADHPARLVGEANKRELRRRLRAMAAEMGAADPDTLGDGLLLLIEGAYISGQLFGAGGPAAVGGEKRRPADRSELEEIAFNDTVRQPRNGVAAMRALLLIPLALAGLCQPAQAGDISSAYTDLDWKKDCVTYAQAEEGEGDWASLACSGYRGYPVLIAYDDAGNRCSMVFRPAT